MSENKYHEKAYGRGCKNGKKATLFDEFAQNNNLIPNWSSEQDSYDKGFKQGVKDKGKK